MLWEGCSSCRAPESGRGENVPAIRGPVSRAQILSSGFAVPLSLQRRSPARRLPCNSERNNQLRGGSR
jgi:hypothetical protein